VDRARSRTTTTLDRGGGGGAFVEEEKRNSLSLLARALFPPRVQSILWFEQFILSNLIFFIINNRFIYFNFFSNLKPFVLFGAGYVLHAPPVVGQVLCFLKWFSVPLSRQFHC